MEKINTKALNLEKLNTEKNKATLGFRCCPKLKLQLAQEAQKLNITLSDYVESIVTNYETGENNLVPELKAKIDFYENDILKDFFTANKGKVFDFKNAKGEPLKITINSLQDIYTVLINSFKTSKQ